MFTNGINRHHERDTLMDIEDHLTDAERDTLNVCAAVLVHFLEAAGGDMTLCRKLMRDAYAARSPKFDGRGLSQDEMFGAVAHEIVRDWCLDQAHTGITGLQ